MQWRLFAIVVAINPRAWTFLDSFETEPSRFYKDEVLTLLPSISTQKIYDEANLGVRNSLCLTLSISLHT